MFTTVASVKFLTVFHPFSLDDAKSHKRSSSQPYRSTSSKSAHSVMSLLKPTKGTSLTNQAPVGVAPSTSTKRVLRHSPAPSTASLKGLV